MSIHLPKHEQSHRQRRVGMIVRRALSAIFQERNYMATISEVRLSRDLRYADVFIAPSFQEKEQTQKEKIETLVKSTPQLRRKLAHAVYLKYVPDLRFHLDASFGHAHRMDVLLSRDEF